VINPRVVPYVRQFNTTSKTTNKVLVFSLDSLPLFSGEFSLGLELSCNIGRLDVVVHIDDVLELKLEVIQVFCLCECRVHSVSLASRITCPIRKPVNAATCFFGLY